MTAQTAGPAGRPNIVLVMTDQQRADFTRAAGFPLDTMPFLDSLGERGVRFERAYTPMPICAPARISLFTGRYPHAHRVRQNSAIGHAVYARDLVDLLREAGYAPASPARTTPTSTRRRWTSPPPTCTPGAAGRPGHSPRRRRRPTTPG